VDTGTVVAGNEGIEGKAEVGTDAGGAATADGAVVGTVAEGVGRIVVAGLDDGALAFGTTVAPMTGRRSSARA
jgi:hypothetical protein